MLRVIREVKPGWVVAENVSGLLSIEGGLVFEQVCLDLENQGYEVQASILPACSVNAPHRRDRVWIVAHSKSAGNNRIEGNLCVPDGGQGAGQLPKPVFAGDGFGETGIIANTNGWGCRNQQSGKPNEFAAEGFKTKLTSHAGKQNIRYRQGGLFTKLTGTDEPGDVAHAENENGRLPIGTVEENSKLGGNGQYVANTQCEGLQKPEPGKQHFGILNAERNDTQDAAHTISPGQQERDIPIITDRQGFSSWCSNEGPTDWANFPTQSSVCGRNDGLPGSLDAVAVFGKPCKPNHARTYSKWRNESIKAYGNAIVPQVAYEVFKAIGLITKNI